MNNVLGHYLNSKHDILWFLKIFERMVEDWRYDELQANFKICQTNPKLCTNVQVLKHATRVYTQEVFEMFENELIKLLDCVEVETIFMYKVIMYGKLHEYTVIIDSLDDTVLFSCQKFEFVGIYASMR